jgi:hypothetical protein
MPDLHDVTGYLLDRGLIDAGTVVDGALRVQSVPRRNRNLRVQIVGGAGYLIKQPGEPDHGGAETLRREAAFLQFCRHEPGAAEAARFLPRPVSYEDTAKVLVQELVPDSVTLWTCLEAADPEAWYAVAGAIGTALGTVHRVFRRPGLADDARLDWLPSGAPWVLSCHEPRPSLLAVLSLANAKALRIVQAEDGLIGRLDWARRLWRPATLIHGDVKADNVLVRPPGAVPAAAWLVDWELAQVGDPAWDLAGVLHETVLVWIASMPTAGPFEVENMAAGARASLTSFWDGSRALWQEYCEAAGCDDNEADALLARAVIFSAARLIQSMYEDLYEREQVTAPAVLSLQLADNILADPRLAQAQLYGLPLGPLV